MAHISTIKTTHISCLRFSSAWHNWAVRQAICSHLSLNSRCNSSIVACQLQCYNHKKEPEDHWSCIAHLRAEDMLKSAVIEEKKFKRSPWAGADNPLGTKFWCQQKPLVTSIICYKFKKISLKSDFIHFFFMILSMYIAPVAGTDNPLGTKFWCQQEHPLTSVICCKFQKNLFEVWFNTCIHVIFSWAQIGRSAIFGREIGVPDKKIFSWQKIFKFKVKNWLFTSL